MTELSMAARQWGAHKWRPYGRSICVGATHVVAPWTNERPL